MSAPRHFSALRLDSNEVRNFPSNNISTTKYSPHTFLFINLFEQLTETAKIYFLLIAILEFIPIVSSVQPTSWFPLLVVLSINLVKEGIEDFRRYQLDKEVNHRRVKGINPVQNINQGSNTPVSFIWSSLLWKDVQVGAILLLEEDYEVPADIIVLSVPSSNLGICYIETANLDGETNLKVKECIEEVNRDIIQTADPTGTTCPMNSIRMVEVECDPPNENLYVFNGSLRSALWSHPLGISNKNVIYRGCVIRNTKWVMGLVTYTGADCKLLRNSTTKRFKRTLLHRATDKFLIFVFLFMAMLCLLMGSLCAMWVSKNSDPVHWYIQSLDSALSSFAITTVTFIILLNVLIPISLTVTLEMIKLGHALFINYDLKICYVDPVTKTVVPARACTSSLSEDLGRIEYIFSDKTGTLTQNVMQLVHVVVEGVDYNCSLSNDIQKSMLTGSYESRLISRFFVHLSLCNTVMVKLEDQDKEGNDIKPTYQASSPDELALVRGCDAFYSTRLFNRAHNQISIQLQTQELVNYELLNVNEFTSSRKRMSVVVRTPSGDIVLMSKGADNVILPRLIDTQDHYSNHYKQIRDNTMYHLTTFAKQGLRTLLIAQRILDPVYYSDWNNRYIIAYSSAQRDELLTDLAEEIERDLDLVGATAVEDKLQVGVPNAIQSLREANIKIWLLTGDQVDTAINIAMSCNLIDGSMKIEKIVEQNEDISLTSVNESNRNQDWVVNQLRNIYDRADTAIALVLEGMALEYGLLREMNDNLTCLEFLQVTSICKTVLCCRVSPRQKAMVVEIVRKKKKRITLAIGDGANDVGMISSADIGVGVRGREGTQAAQAADYVVGQFQYILQLILVHGRWDLQRISALALYFFYKNVALALGACWFAIFSGYSGESFWDPRYQSVWNTIFTALPIMAMSMFDKDVKFQSTLHHFPVLYTEVQDGRTFTLIRLLAWSLDGTWCSLVVFFVPMLACPSNVVDSKWMMSFISLAACHLACNLRLAIITKTWTAWTVVAYTLTLLSYYVWSAVLTSLPPSLSTDMHYMLAETITYVSFWLTILLTQIMALFPSAVLHCYFTILKPGIGTRTALLESILISNRNRKGEPQDGKEVHTMFEQWIGRPTRSLSETSQQQLHYSPPPTPPTPDQVILK